MGTFTTFFINLHWILAGIQDKMGCSKLKIRNKDFLMILLIA